jgi:hypothetical protein
MAIECNFIISPVPGTENFDAVPSINSINSYVRPKRSNDPFMCDEILPQDNNNTYAPM